METNPEVLRQRYQMLHNQCRQVLADNSEHGNTLHFQSSSIAFNYDFANGRREKLALLIDEMGRLTMSFIDQYIRYRAQCRCGVAAVNAAGSSMQSIQQVNSTIASSSNNINNVSGHNILSVVSSENGAYTNSSNANRKGRSRQTVSSSTTSAPVFPGHNQNFWSTDNVQQQQVQQSINNGQGIFVDFDI